MGRRKSQRKIDIWEAKKRAKNIAAKAAQLGMTIVDDDRDPPRPAWLPWNIPTRRWNSWSDEQKKIVEEKADKRLNDALDVPAGRKNKYGLTAKQFDALPAEYVTALVGERINVNKPSLLKKPGSGQVHLVMVKKKDGTVKAFPCRKKTTAEIKAGAKPNSCRTRIPANIKAMMGSK